MTTATDEALVLHGRSISMHCREPGKDAQYHLQLTPAKGLQDPTEWRVVAQYARNGEGLKWATKSNGTLRSAAVETYAGVVAERRRHGYEVVPCGGESQLLRVRQHAALRSTGVPQWPGFLAMAQSVAQDWRDNPRVRAPYFESVVLLADLAYKTAEGTLDAVAQVRQCPGPAHVLDLLSAEIRAWLAPRLPDRGWDELDVAQDLCERCDQW